MLITELAGGFEEDVWFDSCVLHYGELCAVKLSWIRVRERSLHTTMSHADTQLFSFFHAIYTNLYTVRERRGHIQ